MEQEQLEELARRVWAERQIEAARAKRLGIKGTPYYMMNLGHPAVRTLYDEWKAAKGLRREDAPGDIERTCFELELLGPEARRAIREHLERVDAVRAAGAAAFLRMRV